jgi:hypothetical protein
MSKREAAELRKELAHAYQHEAERLIRDHQVGPDHEKAEQYLKKSREMVARLEDETDDHPQSSLGA